MEQVQWQVEGMDCSNCALTIRRYLEKKGMQDVKVNFATGDVAFRVDDKGNKEDLVTGIHDLGYEVKNSSVTRPPGRRLLSTHLARFWFCLPFTLVLMLHMFPSLHIHWLMNPWVQLALALPVYVVGMSFFGKSAIKSIRNGIPNMNVLIAVGATAAFIYSLIGHAMGLGDNYMFYETSATIITLVFLGNYMEDASVASTQKALKKLIKSQVVMANMIAYDDEHQEQIFPVENTQLRVGDLILIKTGEQVPADCKILWGDVQVDESLLTGESLPLHKKGKDKLVGGSTLVEGTAKAQVSAVGDDTVLSGIINMVKQAQGEKPPVQQLADRISAIFVPAVLLIALGTLVINWLLLGDFQESLMRSIAVLVIACPCAMGLATPAAIAVGLGRGARNGILIRNATSLEQFKDIKQVVFDKTGTLTTGKFTIVETINPEQSITRDEFREIVYSLEKYSNHPLAKSITASWKKGKEIHWKKIEEVKGLGMRGEDRDGNEYFAGSFRVVNGKTDDDTHNVYVMKNGDLLGWIDAKDEVRPEAKQVIDYLHSKQIRTILLSGDTLSRTTELGKKLGITEVIAHQSPAEKLKKIEELTLQAPTVMVGDGINDAPALAKATVGVSMSDASHLAMQTSQVVLMNSGLKKFPQALGLGKHTYLTIKQNLFWAFAYNIVAIPVAFLGFLSPTFGALVMGLSDVVLAINSGRLYVKKLV